MASPASIQSGRPQLWLKVSNGKFNEESLNTYVDFIRQYANADPFYGDHEFSVWISRRANTDPSLLEWALDIPHGGWLTTRVNLIQSEIQRRKTAIQQADPNLHSILHPPSGADFHEPLTQHNSLSKIMNRYGDEFEQFNKATQASEELQFKALKYLVQHNISLESEPMVGLRIKHIEKVEFEKAAQLNDGDAAYRKLTAVYDKLNHSFQNDPLPLNPVEFFKLWFPSDEDQLETLANQHLQSAGADAATADANNASPHIICVRHDGNYSMMLARSAKYNYVFAFATS
jgi:hypothetical protein